VYHICYISRMNLTFETEQEEDGRWLTEVPEIAGVMAYGTTDMEAVALAFRALAEQLKNGEFLAQI
jgi:predicted RNase H-like HicB family nuclease